MTHAATLQTDWMRRLQQGESPDEADLRDHLIAVHRDHAGFTESCAMRCRNEAGQTSYEWLADVVEPKRHRHVLDLACGSGPLLELCTRRFGKSIALTGVDMSADELALARRRMPNAPIALHQCMAQNMSVIEDASQDAVLCHWALTLMDPVAPVLGEANRILSSGGIFAAIIDGDMDAAPSYADVHHLIYRWVQREFPAYGRIDLGDPRVRRSGSLAALAEDMFETSTVRIDPAVLTLKGAPEVLAEEASGFFYAAFVLSPTARAAMLRDLADLFAKDGADGCFAMPINRLVVEKA